MHIAPFLQFKLLLQKNILLQKRKKINSLYGISLASAVFVFFIILKFTIIKRKVTTAANLEGAFEVTTNITDLFKGSQARYALAYSPICQQADQIMKNASDYLGFHFKKELGFKDEKELLKKIYDMNHVYAAIVFEWRSFIKNPYKISYKIRIKQAETEEELYYLSRTTSKTFSKTSNASSYGYLRNGFIPIQQAVDKAIIYYLKGDPGKVRSFLKKLPFVPQSSGDYVHFLKTHFSFFVMLGTMVVVSTLCYEVAYERETNVKEYMKLIGLNSAVYWLAWLVKYMIAMLVYVTILTILLHFGIANNSVINHTNIMITFIFLLLYSFDVVAFNFFISSLFNKASSAANAGVLLSFILYIPHFYFIEIYDYIGTRNRMLLSLIHISSLCQGFRIIGMQEEIGSKSSGAEEIFNRADTLGMPHIFFVQILSFMLFMFLAWLIDTFASKHFLLSKVIPKSDIESRPEESYITFLRIEKSPYVSTIIVKIQGLFKKFRNHIGPEVLNFSLDISEKETVAILGSEHSGKTTVYSILIGLITPTKGSVDIMTKLTGFAFKFDVFFEDLTVEENLELLAKLKGCDKHECFKEVEKILFNTDLVDNRKMFPKSLNKLLRRKLSIGIAFLAGSKLIILDEPTYDFDLEARLEIWHLLKSLKRGHTIVITTHYMDEAEYLASRIAVMELGKLQTYGSSKFLRETHDTGYYLNIVAPKNSEAEKIDQIVSSTIPEAIIVSNAALELSYFLPKKSFAKFVELFDMLETVIENGEIKAFGVSFNTADENFFKLNRTKTLEVREKLKQQALNVETRVIDPKVKQKFFEDAKKMNSWINKFKITFRSKMLCVSRRKLFLLFHMLLPLIITLYVEVTGSYIDARGKNPEFHLHMLPYPRAITPYSYSFGSYNKAMRTCLEKYLHRFKVQIRYVDTRNDRENFIDILLEMAQSNIHNYRRNYYLGALVADDHFIGLYNDEFHHTVAMSLSMVNNAWLNCLMEDSKRNVYIETSNHPLPTIFANQSSIDFEVFSLSNPQTLLKNALVFFLTLFIISTIQDKITGLKSVQNIGQLNLFFYWVSTFILDIIFYIIFTNLLVVILFLRQVKGYSDLTMVKYSILLSIAFGFASLPLVYVFSLFFHNPRTGIVVEICFFVLMYMISNLGFSRLLGNVISFDKSAGKIIANILKPIFPFLLLSDGMKNLYINQENYLEFEKCIEKQTKICINHQKSYLDWNQPGILKILVILVLNAIFYSSLLLLFESKFVKRIQHFVYSKRVENFIQLTRKTKSYFEKKGQEQDTRKYCLESKDLYKLYSKNLEALKKLNLKVEEGEVFCLLGREGSGKSSVFKVLTKNEAITSGVVLIDGINADKNNVLTSKTFGYYPQEDGLIDQMTVREVLRLYANLKGIKEDKQKEMTDNMMKTCNLSTHKNHYVHMLSRLSKGKLGIAVAAIGFPRILLLDEPTEGMDHRAMREIWRCIYEIKKIVPTILIATTNVQECDAVGTKIGIMVKGQIKFLGDNTAAKNKVSVRVSLLFENFDKENAVQVHSFVKRFYPDASLQRMNNDTYKYYITKDATSGSLGQIFKNIENNKVDLNIKRYAVYYSSLEYLFFSFNKKVTKNEK